MPIRTSLLFLELTVFDLEVMLRRELCFQQGVMLSAGSYSLRTGRYFVGVYIQVVLSSSYAR